MLHAPAQFAVSPMCEKCKALDEKIVHYRRFTTTAFDLLTTSRIQGLIDEMQAQRDAMHLKDKPIS